MTRRLDDEFPVRTFADPTDFERAREWFTDVGYSAGVLPRKLSIGGTAPPGDVEGRALETRLAIGEPLDELLRLFTLGRPLSDARAREALGPVAPERWAEAGILVSRGEEWQCPLRLVPFPGDDTGWGISDSSDCLRRPDYIMPPTFAAAGLAEFMIRSPADSLLDLGAGAGYLAILAAGFARRVTGSDFCPRAIPMARFNARLNGRPDIEWVEGSLFEPFEGRRFDRIVANLPFVLGPGAGLLYRDAGPVFDGLAWRAALAAGNHLEEGGVCQMQVHWPLREGEKTEGVFGAALARSGVDAWVMVTGIQAVTTYVHDYLTEVHYPRSPEFATETIRSLDYFREQGVAQVGLGILILRRRTDGENWLHIGDAPQYVGHCGDDIERGLATRTLLNEGLPDESLLASRPIVDPGLRMSHEAEVEDASWSPLSVRLRRTRGLAWEGNTDLVLAGMAARCDGRTTGAELVAGLARATGRREDEVRGPGLTALRTMIELGFVHLEGY